MPSKAGRVIFLFSIASNFLLTSSDLDAALGDLGSIGAIKRLIPAALFSLTYLLTILDLLNKRKVKCYPYSHTTSVSLIVSELTMVTD
jgi:hypothetical protein